VSASALLEALLGPGGLTPRFQPILELHSGGQRLHGLECLMRGPRGSNLERTEVLFGYVRRKKVEGLVDRACVTAALGAACQLFGGHPISINLHASTLGERGFVDFFLAAAASQSIDTRRLTVDVVEHSPCRDESALGGALGRLRARGVEIALDGVGTGHSHFGTVLQCRPDWLKIDPYFVHGSHADFRRQAVIESGVELARSVGARVVAEGVETEPDLEAVRRLGIGFVQGFFFTSALPPAECGEWIRSRPAGGSWTQAPVSAPLDSRLCEVSQ
jgi:EAL domain-containing protein (putative c-di-GMP-specific phosphodiesterase class I)